MLKEVHYNLGNAYTAQQETGEALKEYREVLRLRPDFPGVYMNIGALEEAGGQIPQAIADYLIKSAPSQQCRGPRGLGASV